MIADSGKAVKVGGIDVTQEMLERFFSVGYPTLHRGEPLPEGYTPDLGAFRPHDGNGEPTPEQQAYALLSRTDLLGVQCRACAMSQPYTEPEPEDNPPEQPEYRSPVQTLLQAGFPRPIAVRGIGGLGERHKKVDAWGAAYRGEDTPWLWIIAPNEDEGICVAAQAALVAARAMDEDRAHKGEILFVDAYNLCGIIDSANQYGENNKTVTLMQYDAYQLLCISLRWESANQRTLGLFSRLIANRHARALPTVFVCSSGLSKWSERFRRFDPEATRTMVNKIVQALCGYETDKTRAAQALDPHVITL